MVRGRLAQAMPYLPALSTDTRASLTPRPRSTPTPTPSGLKCFSLLVCSLRGWQVHLRGPVNMVFPKSQVFLDFSDGEESTCQCRKHGFNPWSGNIPHAAEQLSLCASTTELMHLEPVLCDKRNHCNKKPCTHNSREPVLSNKTLAQPKI